MLVDTFKQEKAIVGAFSVIVKLRIIFAKVRLKLYTQPRHVLSRAPLTRICLESQQRV